MNVQQSERDTLLVKWKESAVKTNDLIARDCKEGITSMDQMTVRMRINNVWKQRLHPVSLEIIRISSSCNIKELLLPILADLPSNAIGQDSRRLPEVVT